MARGVVIEGALGAGLGIAAWPDADIDRIDRFATRQGVSAEQVLQRAGADLADRQRVVEAAPAAPLLRLHTQHRQRRDGASGQQRIAHLAQGVDETPKGRIGRRAKAGE
jgi:hypothetical protein